MTLPADSPERRQITRPVEYRQPGFADEFDATTVFYDVIARGPWPLGRLVLVGPPLRNFTQAIMAGRINGRPIRTLLSRYFERDRCCDIWLSTTLTQPVYLQFGFGSALLFPSRAEPRRYAGRRVLYTLSKDNNPVWVIDWARFHVANHAADAVLIYDNGSVRYTSSELLATLRAALPGLPVDVVSWPFRYGPGGFSSASGWDSDFCQAAAFQDARFRFLERAAGVLNCDVDEFVVSTGGRSVFEAAATSTAGCVAFAGDWIAATRRPSDPKGSPRHGDFVHRETSRGDAQSSGASCPPGSPTRTTGRPIVCGCLGSPKRSPMSSATRTFVPSPTTGNTGGHRRWRWNPFCIACMARCRPRLNVRGCAAGSTRSKMRPDKTKLSSCPRP